MIDYIIKSEHDKFVTDHYIADLNLLNFVYIYEVL